AAAARAAASTDRREVDLVTGPPVEGGKSRERRERRERRNMKGREIRRIGKSRRLPGSRHYLGS
ncbi:hypothetical protein, partial [Streptomyces sp. MnatMP-M17]|uniref:hypothetical protein n=1 Tax=Streptomyces sp. MnatMP-M17 TaxID=1839780 RepID=UPI001C402FF4